MATSAIAALEAIPLVTPTANAADLDGSSDTVLARITDDQGAPA